MLSPSRRVTGTAVLIGLLGAALATLALVDVSAGPSAAHRARSGAGPGRTPPAGQAAGKASSQAALRLLSAAAEAGTAITYHGVQIVAWWGPRGSTTSEVQVWHERDRGTLVQVTDAGSASAAKTKLPASEQDADGILGLPPQLLGLIRTNYQAAEAGRGRAAGRPAQIVELRRPDGSLAARYWLDAATKLPLRREIFDSRARMISEDAFLNVRIGASGLTGMPAGDARPWSARLDPAQIAALRARGWPLPAGLPGNLRLVSAHQTMTTAGPVIDLGYSDGLSVVSVFLQRGQLDGVLPGWREVALRGRPVYSADPDLHSLAWSARGFVYTVIAEAPPATVDQIIDALPHDAGPGFWGRIAHGLRRLAAMANPFR